MQRIDPDYADLGALADDDAAWQPRLVGVNRARRVETQRSAAARVGLFLPDRLLDLIDLVSFDVHVGPGLRVDAHATRAVQANAGARSTFGAGLETGRMLGVQARSDAGIAVLALGAQMSGMASAGTAGARASSAAVSGVHDPYDVYYQQHADYWSLGASGTALLAGAGWEVHPVQLLDFLAGWVGIDLLADDFSHTRGLRLSREQNHLLLELARIQRSESSVERYLEAKGGPIPSRDVLPAEDARDPVRTDPEVPASPAPQP